MSSSENNEVNESIDTFNVPEEDRAKWITVFDSEYYPDFLNERETLHKPTLITFRNLAEEASSSPDLYRKICEFTGKERVQLCRVFRKYVSPDTSVEMLKKKTKAEKIIRDFKEKFRPIKEVKEKLFNRPEDDVALFAILGEYDNRGTKGYDLTEIFFDWFEPKFIEKKDHERFELKGPKRAGKDINLANVLPGYESDTPADFIIFHEGVPRVVGWVRYDTDRGGAQEDDRYRGNRESAQNIMNYSHEDIPDLKALFINDGPGLLLGSMWDDYVKLENINSERIIVSTFIMLEDRVTEEWILK